jgi:23S rRNA pseudouridine1911/1915/1917 synthase
MEIRVKSSTQNTTRSIVVPQENSALRIDSFIAQHMPEYSRSFFKKLLNEQLVTINGKTAKASSAIKPNDCITVQFPPPKPLFEPTSGLRDALSSFKVRVRFEHPHFFIIEKPAHLVVHKPSTKSSDVTLVDWLLLHNAEIADVGIESRPGIVHRLDKETSGLMIIPRTNYAHMKFSEMFKDRRIKKTYLAIVSGHPEPQGTIDLPIGRDKFCPTKMSHHTMNGRNALTHYEVIQYFEGASLVKAQPITGRTHQIRVHFAALGHPLIGDHVYAKKSDLINRHALHATRLSFTFDTQDFSFEQEPPTDFKEVLKRLSHNKT